MRALLVWPKFESFSFWNFERVYRLAGAKYMTPPLGLLTVAALLPQDWEIRLVDENVRPLAAADIEWSDVVLVGAKIVHRQRALDVIRWARDLGKPVAVGGPDPTLNDSFYQGVADYLCLGEGELTIPLLLDDLRAGRRGCVYRPAGMADLTTTPPPRFDLVDFRDYLYVGVQYSRGCPYRCEFCNVIDLFPRYTTKTLEQVLAELDVLYRLGYRGQVDFFDDNLVGNFKAAKPILRGLARWLEERKFPFQFSTSVTINIAKDDELLELLRQARFKYLLVGIESPSEDALRTAQKPQNTGLSLADAVDRIYRKAGATVHSGFLLGLDGEPPDIGDQTIRCIEETAIPWVMAGIVYPLPGTQLATRLDREGRLFARARTMDMAELRDQISAGLAFRPQRPALDVLSDLCRILVHSFDPEKYFARCADVASRLDTIPRLVPGWRVFFRNVKIFFRLCVALTRQRATRRFFWRAFWRVLRENRAGMEALVTLSALFLHFREMLGYCLAQLERQRREIEAEGEEAWVIRQLPPRHSTADKPPPVRTWDSNGCSSPSGDGIRRDLEELIPRE